MCVCVCVCVCGFLAVWLCVTSEHTHLLPRNSSLACCLYLLGKRLRVRRVMVYPLSWLDRVLLQPAKRQAHTVQACANGHRSGSTAVTAASMVAQCGGYGSTLQRARSVPGPVSERSTASSLLLSTRDCSIKQPSHSGFNYRSSAHRVVDRAMTLLCVCFILVAAYVQPVCRCARSVAEACTLTRSLRLQGSVG